MKIEIGESLMLSYFKHVKMCTFYQTNWKVSSNWNISNEALIQVQLVYDKIMKHSEFSEVFKSELNQLIKQSEIDVIGINSLETIYTADIAFHEGGLNYKDKTETKNRVFKKLLRSYLTLLAFFPNKKYELIFASPKVNPATEKIIIDNFDILLKDFSTDNVSFKYYANQNFSETIFFPTIEKSINDSDTNELFMRSIILNKMFEKNKHTNTGVQSLKNIENDFNDELIIEFEPKDQKIFEQELIKTKTAKRLLFYKDGRIVTQLWDAKNYKTNLIGNIRSNNTIRNWKKNGIFKVKCEIIYH